MPGSTTTDTLSIHLRSLVLLCQQLESAATLMLTQASASGVAPSTLVAAKLTPIVTLLTTETTAITAAIASF